MTYSLEGFRALVCGSTQGIGRACAIEMARQGAEVTLMARNESGLAKVQSELPAAHGQTHRRLVADFTDWQAVGSRAEQHVEAHGPVQILLNNTGGPSAGPLFEAEADALLGAFTQHIVCNQALVRVTVPGMREAGYGRIVNIISTSVILPIQGLGVSNVTRGAVGNWGRALAGELGPHGITVNNILPGYTRTARLDSLIQGRAQRAGSTVDQIEQGMTGAVPLRRFATPQEIGAVAAFLASPAASYLNGLNLPVDGGRLAVQ
ncbi:MAG: SDR family oxidoreductase [Planctomycetota bacterium]|jgi:3-oxoacyl-[acyl-carrier protein] reductase